MVWNWVSRIANSDHNPPTAKPSWVAVDVTAVKINGEWSWLYAAIDIERELIPNVELLGRHGTNLAAAFLHGLREKHDLSDTILLVDQLLPDFDRLSGVELSSELYRPGPHRRVVPHLKMRIDWFHNSWVGSRSSVREWLEQFMHCYN